MIKPTSSLTGKALLGLAGLAAVPVAGVIHTIVVYRLLAGLGLLACLPILGDSNNCIFLEAGSETHRKSSQDGSYR